MSVTVTFVQGTTDEQARLLLHRIGELPEVETFGYLETAPLDQKAAPSVVIFERDGDNAEEDERAREQIALMLRRSPYVHEIQLMQTQEGS